MLLDLEGGLDLFFDRHGVALGRKDDGHPLVRVEPVWKQRQAARCMDEGLVKVSFADHAALLCRLDRSSVLLFATETISVRAGVQERERERGEEETRTHGQVKGGTRSPPKNGKGGRMGAEEFRDPPRYQLKVLCNMLPVNLSHCNREPSVSFSLSFTLLH